jgi:hypothetical protein
MSAMTRVIRVLFATFVFIIALGPVTTLARTGDGAVVSWKRIVGILDTEGLVGRRPGTDCEAGIDCPQGTVAPWVVTDGTAQVDLGHEIVKFVVNGLVLAGDPSFANLGTPGVVSKIKGTLVCNDTGPGSADIVDTGAVRLVRGNAIFVGHVDLPVSCSAEPDDIVFLIRVAEVSDEAGNVLIDRWNAFGAVRSVL